MTIRQPDETDCQYHVRVTAPVHRAPPLSRVVGWPPVSEAGDTAEWRFRATLDELWAVIDAVAAWTGRAGPEKRTYAAARAWLASQEAVLRTVLKTTITVAAKPPKHCEV